MSSSAPTQRQLVRVTLDENSIGSSNPDVEHERAVAIYDLLEDHVFHPNGLGDGPFALHLSMAGNRLVFDIQDESGSPILELSAAEETRLFTANPCVINLNLAA